MTDQSTRTSSAGDPPDGTTDQAKHQASAVAETGKQQAGEVVNEAKAQTSQLFDEARGRARDRADTQLSQLAGALDEVSGELEQMADGSENAESSYLTALARDGSKTAASLSRRLDEGGLDGALDDVRRFARQRPVAFLAGALGVGLLLGRVTRNADLGKITSTGDDAASEGRSGEASASFGSITGDGADRTGDATGLERLDAPPTGSATSSTPASSAIPEDPDLVAPPAADAPGTGPLSTGRQP